MLEFKFIKACMGENLKRAKSLLSHHPDLNIHANKDEAFRLAASYGHFETAEWLLECGEIDVKTHQDEIFEVTCRCGRLKAARWIFDLASSLGHPIDLHANGDKVFRSTRSYWQGIDLATASWLFRLGESTGQPYSKETIEDMYLYARNANHLKAMQWCVLRGQFSRGCRGLKWTDPIRMFHVDRFPIAVLIFVYLRRYLNDFRERFYCPGGKGFLLARERFYKAENKMLK